MLTPIRCFTCGFPIGDIATQFVAMKNAIIKAELDRRGISYEGASVDARQQVELDPVLRELGLPPEQHCCRAALISTIRLPDVY